MSICQLNPLSVNKRLKHRMEASFKFLTRKIYSLKMNTYTHRHIKLSELKSNINVIGNLTFTFFRNISLTTQLHSIYDREQLRKNPAPAASDKATSLALSVNLEHSGRGSPLLLLFSLMRMSSVE